MGNYPMNFSSQIETNPWLNFSMVGLVWLFNSLCLLYCIATAVVIVKMLFA